MTILFTADTHFGHANAIKHCNRPFSSAEEMDVTMIKRWNRKVSPNDTVYHLGDVAFSNIERVKEVFSQLNGKIYLVPGNHDAALMKKKEFRDLFVEVLQPIFETKIGAQHVVMCHYPMDSWNRSFHGSIHLHGHTHGTVHYEQGFNRMDVGVDVHNFSPITWDEVKLYMGKE